MPQTTKVQTTKVQTTKVMQTVEKTPPLSRVSDTAQENTSSLRLAPFQARMRGMNIPPNGSRASINHVVQRIEAGAQHPLQKHEDFMYLQRTIGNRAVVQLLDRMQNSSTKKQDKQEEPTRARDKVETTRFMPEKEISLQLALDELDEVMNNAPKDPLGAVRASLQRVVAKYQLQYAHIIESDGLFRVEAKVNPGGTTIARADIRQGLANINAINTLINGAPDLPQGVTFDVYVNRMLMLYEDSFEDDTNDNLHLIQNASKIAIVVRAISRSLARELGNPWLAPELGKKVAEHYRPELQHLVTSKNATDAATTITLAKTISSGDPVMLYMTDKIDKPKAASKIASMAQDAHISGSSMFDLLSQQFQVEIGAFNQAQITAGRLSTNLPDNHKKLSGEDDLIGEISPTFFGGVADLDDQGDTQWGAGSLQMNQAMSVKLAALGTAADTAIPANRAQLANVPAGLQNLTPRQQHYINDVDLAEAGMNTGNMRNNINVALRTLYGITPNEAGRLLTQYVNRFTHIPLTITFNAEGMFANANPNLRMESALKRETTDTAFSTVLPDNAANQQVGGTFEKTGIQNGMAQHRNNPAYMRWRFEKDAPPPGFSGLEMNELPEFAAMSPSFRIAGGSDTLASFGENQYGTSHFKFRDTVRARAMYQFTAKGPLRRDPIVLLNDILVLTPDTFNQLKQQKTQALGIFNQMDNNDPGRPAQLLLVQRLDGELNTAKTKYIQSLNVSHALMAFIIEGNTTFLDQQQIEVQIFGDINIATDVSEIVIKDNINVGALNNLHTFAANNNIVVTGAAQPPQTTMKAISGADRAKETLDAAWMVNRYLHSVNEQWVPTKDAFKSDSSTWKRRSGDLRRIDTALENYEAVRNNPDPNVHADPNAHAPLLQGIITRIRQWQANNTGVSSRRASIVKLLGVTTRLFNMMSAL